MTEMSERELLSRIGHGSCAVDIMSEALAEFYRSRGMDDAARVIVDWLSTREEMSAGSYLDERRGLSGADIAIERAVQAFHEGEPDRARELLVAYMEGD